MKLVKTTFENKNLTLFDIYKYIKFEKIIENNNKPDYINASNIIFLEKFLEEHHKNPHMKKFLLDKMGYSIYIKKIENEYSFQGCLK